MPRTSPSQAARAIEYKINQQRVLLGFPPITLEGTLRLRYVTGQIDVEEFEHQLDVLLGLVDSTKFKKVDWLEDVTGVAV